MDKEFVASELIKVAKDLVGSEHKAMNPNQFYRELDFIKIGFAEAGLSRLRGKKFNNPRAAEKAVNMFDPPDVGYDKVEVFLHMKDGTVLKGFRYDHSEKDPSFTEQLNWYVRNRVNLS